MLLLLFMTAVLAVSPLTNASVYIETFGTIDNLPANCTASCPQNKCLHCTLTMLPDCSFTDFMKVTNGSVGIYTTQPSKACQRDSLYIYDPGYYRLTINRVGQFLQLVPFMKQSSDYDILVDFVLGYSFE